MDIQRIYELRFPEKTCGKRDDMWRILCGYFFQKHVPVDSTVLDIGSGYCEFINNIRGSKKYALDINETTRKYAHTDVDVVIGPSTDLSFLKDNSVDVVFMSNFLEHLVSKDDIVKTLLETFRVLKPEGRVMVLGPNIRYLCGEYWDFFDHHIPLSDKSVCEILQVTGFSIVLSIPRFLPYTTKSAIPQALFLVKAYLRIPFMWRVLGRQMLVIAKKTCTI